MAFLDLQDLQPLLLINDDLPRLDQELALQRLYRDAARLTWTMQVDNVASGACNLETATQCAQVKMWTPGLQTHAMVMDMLGMSAFQTADVESAWHGLRTAFEQYTYTDCIAAVTGVPACDMQSYIAVWQLSEKMRMGVALNDSSVLTHPGLECTVPRRKRSGQSNLPKHEALPMFGTEQPESNTGDIAMAYQAFQDDVFGQPLLHTPVGHSAFVGHGMGTANSFTTAGSTSLKGDFMPFAVSKLPTDTDPTVEATNYDFSIDVDAHIICSRPIKSEKAGAAMTPDETLVDLTPVRDANTPELVPHFEPHAEEQGAGAEQAGELRVDASGDLSVSESSGVQVGDLDKLETLQSTFHQPIDVAAKTLGVSLTVLKLRSRRHGITRWPYRKLASLDKLINSCMQVAQQAPEDGRTLMALKELVAQRNAVYADPNHHISEWCKKLRQAHFKQEYNLRQKAGDEFSP